MTDISETLRNLATMVEAHPEINRLVISFGREYPARSTYTLAEVVNRLDILVRAYVYRDQQRRALEKPQARLRLLDLILKAM